MYKVCVNHINLKLLWGILALVIVTLCSGAYGMENPNSEKGKKMKIAIITAMQSEFDAVKSLYQFTGSETEKTAQVYGKDILLIKSGMGKVNAAVATERACRAGADLVINTGLAGGIDDVLEQGDIVLAEKVSYHDVWCGEGNAKGQVQDFPLYYPAPQKIIEKITKNNPSFKLGVTVTGDQFVTDENVLRDIKATFPGAYAVDMESAAVAHTCYLNNVPYLSLRIISDVVGKKGQIEQYHSFRENMPKKSADMVDDVLKAISTD